MTITEDLLLSLNTKVGDDFVVYDVAGNHAMFFHHGDAGFRPKQHIRKRQNSLKKVKVRPTDGLFRVETDGTVIRGPVGTWFEVQQQ